MNLIIKYILKNIFEKKTRSLLVLLSIAVSAALFFATMGMSNTCRQMYVDQAVQLGGTSDIKIEVKDEVGKEAFISNDSLADFSDQMEYAIGMMKVEGLSNPESVEDFQYLDVRGISLENLATYNSYELEQSGEIADFTGKKVIISAVFAKQQNVSLGDSVTIKIGGTTNDFVVEGIAEQSGVFLNESNGYIVVVPRDTLEDIYGISEQSNFMFVKVRDGVEVNAVIKGLAEALPNCSVSQSVNESDLNQAVNTVVMPFMVSALTVIFMSIFIIFTSFHLITLERLPSIGTLRSVGTSKKRLEWVFTLESILWGIAGGLLGCVIGIVALYTIVVAYVQKLSEGTKLSVSFGPKQILLTIGLAVVLTMISAIPPLFGALKKSTKNIILNISEEKKKNKGLQGLKLLLLVMVFGVCVVIPHMMETGLMCMIITIVCMTFILLVMILVIPYGIHFISNILTKNSSSNNTTWIAMRNIETNKSLLNIVRLLTISVASILIISNISNAISNTITSVYDTYHLYDISLAGRTVDECFCERLSQVEGVHSFTNSYELDSAEIEEVSFYFNTLYGIENEDFFQFMGAEMDEEASKAIAELNDGRNIVLTHLMASKLNLKIGDEIHIQIDQKSYPYTITGLVESSFKLGNIGFVSAELLRNDIGIKYYTNTYVKAENGSDVDDVRNHIKAEFLEELVTIQTLEELIEINKDLIVSIFRIINAYAILAVIIGIIGIMNNIIVCFIERKRELAMYRIVGMSMKTMRVIFLKESLLIGISGIVFAFIGATGILVIVPSMLSFIFGNVTMKLNIALYLIFAVVGIAVICLLSLLPIAKSAKNNIIESIRYE